MPGNESEDLEVLLAVRDFPVACDGEIQEFARGGVVNLISEGHLESFREGVLHFFPPGKIGARGGHLHRYKSEVFTVHRGEITVDVYDPGNDLLYTQILGEGKCFNLPPFYAHSLYNHTDKETILIECADLEFNPGNPQNDVYLVPIRDMRTKKLISG